MWRARWAPAAAVMSLAAASIHSWAALVNYQEWWGFGAFYMSLATGQASFAAILIRYPHPMTYLLGIAGNVLIILLYGAALGVGIETVGLVSLASKAVELVLVFTLFALLLTNRQSNRPPVVIGSSPSTLLVRNTPTQVHRNA